MADASDEDARRLLREIRDATADALAGRLPDLIMGRVLSVTGSGETLSASISVNGRAEAVPALRWLNSYVPHTGDSVHLLKKGNRYLVLGSVKVRTGGGDPPPDTGGLGDAGVVGTVSAWDDSTHTIDVDVAAVGDVDGFTLAGIATLGWYYGVVGDIVYCLNFGTSDAPQWLCLGSGAKMTSYTLPHDDTSPFVPGP